MNTGILIFVAVALWLWVKIRKAYKGEEERSYNDSTTKVERSESAFESLFNSASSEFDGSYANTSSTFASKEADGGYFTYETIEDPLAEQPRPKGRTARTVGTPESPIPAPAEQTEVPAKPDFDLRQAVLYQTILDNKYLSEVQSLDN